MFYYLKNKVVFSVFHYKYFIWFSKAIIHCAIRLMHLSQFAICHLAVKIFPSAPMFQAQQASTRGFNQSIRPRAMEPSHQATRNVHYHIAT